jgi:hypothetical protein
VPWSVGMYLPLNKHPAGALRLRLSPVRTAHLPQFRDKWATRPDAAVPFGDVGAIITCPSATDGNPPSKPASTIRDAMHHRTHPYVLALTFAIFGLAGCGSQSEIESYSVEKTEPPRILVATVLDGQKVWFFKMTGTANRVEDHLGDFRTFVESVKFKQGEPNWAKPKGWDENDRGALSQFPRYASFGILTKTEVLDVSVTSLTAPAQERIRPTLFDSRLDAEYLTINLNRWRDQVNLERIDASDELGSHLQPVSIDGATGLLADITGSIAPPLIPSTPQSRGPHAAGPGAAGPGAAGPGAAGSSPPLRESRFEYVTPDHWVDRGPATMVEQSWTVGEAAEQVRITLSFAGGDLPANINRWRGQVGLPNLPPDEIQGEPIEVTGKASQMFDLDGEKKRIIGIIVPAERLSLFVKITGPAAKVAAEKASFLDFARTLKMNN